MRPSVRKAFGCDAPIKGVVFRTSCPVCWRERWTMTPLPKERPPWPFVQTQTPTSTPDSEGVWQCVGCGGTGEVGWKQCPRTMAGEHAREIVRLWQRYRDGHLPMPGAWSEQTQFASAAFDICSFEWSKIEERRREFDSEE